MNQESKAELEKRLIAMYTEIHDLRARRFQAKDHEERSLCTTEIGRLSQAIWRVRADLNLISTVGRNG